MQRVDRPLAVRQRLPARRELVLGPGQVALRSEQLAKCFVMRPALRLGARGVGGGKGLPGLIQLGGHPVARCRRHVAIGLQPGRFPGQAVPLRLCRCKRVPQPVMRMAERVERSGAVLRFRGQQGSVRLRLLQLGRQRVGGPRPLRQRRTGARVVRARVVRFPALAQQRQPVPQPGRSRRVGIEREQRPQRRRHLAWRQHAQPVPVQELEPRMSRPQLRPDAPDFSLVPCVGAVQQHHRLGRQLGHPSGIDAGHVPRAVAVNMEQVDAAVLEPGQRVLGRHVEQAGERVVAGVVEPGQLGERRALRTGRVAGPLIHGVAASGQAGRDHRLAESGIGNPAPGAEFNQQRRAEGAHQPGGEGQVAIPGAVDLPSHRPREQRVQGWRQKGGQPAIRQAWRRLDGMRHRLDGWRSLQAPSMAARPRRSRGRSRRQRNDRQNSGCYDLFTGLKASRHRFVMKSPRGGPGNASLKIKSPLLKQFRLHRVISNARLQLHAVVVTASRMGCR